MLALASRNWSTHYRGGSVVPSLVVDTAPGNGVNGNGHASRFNGAGADLAATLAGLAGALNPYLETSTAVDVDQVGAIVDTALEPIRAELDNLRSAPPRRVEFVIPDSPPVVVDGSPHPSFDRALRKLVLSQPGKRPKHVLLVGPAGAGKTHAAADMARVLGLDFHPFSVGRDTRKSDLLGFIDANGNYQETPIYRAFVNGGLLLLDEIDTGNPGALTILDSLLANGHCSFPCGVKSVHADFRCVAGSNTWLNGADATYLAGQASDCRIGDRFAFVDWGYDLAGESERTINADWCRWVQLARDAVKALGLKRVVISQRAIVGGEDELAAGYPLDEVKSDWVFKGADSETVRKIEAWVSANGGGR